MTINEKIMKKNSIIFLFASVSLLIGCTKDFKEINTDPNRIERISPGTLLNPTIYEVAAFNTTKSDDVTFNLMQVMLPFPSVSGGVHRYDLTESAGNSTWNTYYRWLLNVKEMYEAANAAGDDNYKAIAMTLNAWIYSNLTDAFGDVPKDQAVRAEEGILRPAFNRQQDIYTRLLLDLDSANTLYNTTIPMIYGTDILYSNNVANWKRFANSLKLRLLLRVSGKPEMNSWEELRKMIDAPATYPVFASNDQGAVLRITGVTPNLSPWGRAIDFTTFRAAAAFFIDNLNNFNDPRLPRFATQARSLDGTTAIGYKGIPSGYSNDAQFDYLPSNLNVALATAPMISLIMPYAEVEFIKAEVEHHFNREAQAKLAYEKGVKAAIEQWGAVMPADYFQNPAAAWDGTLERIMLQKYYGLFFVDYQAWFEYRRTGFPDVPKNSGMLNNGIMPVRFRYPPTVQSTNNENYNQAVEWMGGDDINTKVWWEK
jgi:hypothetical protein